MDTNSFIVYIKTEDIYKDITKDVETRFDASKESPLLLANMEKSSKPDQWLQNEWCSFMAESLSPFTPFTVRAETPKCLHILSLRL